MAFDLAISGCIASIWSLYLAIGQSFLASASISSASISSASISSAFKPNMFVFIKRGEIFKRFCCKVGHIEENDKRKQTKCISQRLICNHAYAACGLANEFFAT